MSSKKHIYTVGIIGAGRIAAGFDTPTLKEILTHAHAISKNRNLKLLGFTDVNKNAGVHAAKKWKTSFFPSISDMLDIRPDVIVIATPDQVHARNLLEVAKSKHPPKLIICEKPLINKKGELAALGRIKNPPQILVNYSLRFDPLFRAVREDIKNEKYGNVISANATYSHGFFHNGSHTIDICRFFFGEMKTCKATFLVDDLEGGSGSMGGVATFERCPRFYLMTGDERYYSASGFEILTEKGRLRFLNFNYEFSFENVVPDPHYAGFKVLTKPVIKKTQRMKAFPNLYKHAVGVLNGMEEPVCGLDEAIRSQEACFKFFESLNQ